MGNQRWKLMTVAFTLSGSSSAAFCLLTDLGWRPKEAIR